MNIFVIFMIFGIGLPTIYALFFGAPWVPTPWAAIEKMLILAKLKKGKNVYDLGCGDGRMIIEAGKFEANAIGYEISPLVYLAAIIRNLFSGFKAKIKLKSFWNEDLSDADVIFLYLLPKSMKKLAIKFKKELKPSARIISYAFKLDDLELVEEIERDRRRNICPIRVYKVRG